MLTGVARKYLGRGQVDMPTIRAALWTPEVTTESYRGEAEKYQAAILDQYKIYVEMADRVSARRGSTNTFFLAVNTAVFTLVNVIWAQGGQVPRVALALPLAILIAQCAAWSWILRSYRQLASVKYRVVGALEERLPASPYWRAEWKGLGSGRDRSLYWPMAYLEQWVPAVFGVAYLVLLGLVLAVRVP